MMKRKKSCTGMQQNFCSSPEQGTSHFTELPDFIPKRILRHPEVL